MMNTKDFLGEMSNDLRAYAVTLNALMCAIERGDNEPSEYTPGLAEIEHKLNVLSNKCKEV